MSKNKYQAAPGCQRGAVLIVGLIMVLLISIIAMSAIRSSNMQESMAGNMRDRNMAFQSAESALIEGESVIDVRSAASAPVCTGKETCYLRYEQDPKLSIVFQNQKDFEALAREVKFELKAIEKKPFFVIEEVTPFTPQDGGAIDKSIASEFATLSPYRITSLGTGLGSDSLVMLQTTYNRLANSD